MIPYIDQIKSITIFVKYGDSIACHGSDLKEISLLSLNQKKRLKNQTASSAFINVSKGKKVLLRIYAWCLRRLYMIFPRLKPSDKNALENVLIQLLSHETTKECLIGTPLRRKMFLESLGQSGFFENLEETIDSTINQMLSHDRDHYFTVHAAEYYLDNLLISEQQKTTVLGSILHSIYYLPVISHLKVEAENDIGIEMKTTFSQYQVLSFDLKQGEVEYHKKQDKTTSIFSYYLNEEQRTVASQRQVTASVLDHTESLSFACGEISTIYHGLEQLFFMENLSQEKIQFYKSSNTPDKQQCYLFLSLYTPEEYEKIANQMKVVEFLDQSVLNADGEETKIEAYYFNLPFTKAGVRFPSEAQVLLNDLYDQNLIRLLNKVNLIHQLDLSQLSHLSDELNETRSLSDPVKKEERVRDIIQRFGQIKEPLLEKLEQLQTPYARYIEVFLKPEVLEEKTPLDLFIYLDLMTKDDFKLSINCSNSIDYTAMAISAKKAQFSYFHMTQKPFIPHEASEADLTLFKGLYTMYLKWEEPEITSYLTLGADKGEQIFKNLVKKNHDLKHLLF